MSQDTQLVAALHFAAERHRRQRRKDLDSSPYINHVIEVAHVLADVGGVFEKEVLLAAVLHDTIGARLVTEGTA